MSFRFIIVFFAIFQIIWADSFRLVTYNILSNDYLWDGIYDHVCEDILNWENRRVKIVERIKKIAPDVVCLQELNTVSFEYFKKSLEDFEGTFAKKGNSSHHGVGTFCKRGTFKKTHHRIVLCEGTSNCACRPVQPAIFTDLLLKNGKSITLINTKIKWIQNIKLGDPVWNHVQFILNSMTEAPTIIVGDFNMKPDHPLMHDFYSAGLQDGFLDKNTYSCYANKDFQRVDYILSTKDLKSIPIESFSLASAKPIPNENEPSDHLPLGRIIIYE